MFWKKTDDGMSNTVEFTVESAWRYSYGRQHFVPQVSSSGDTVVKINGAVTPMITFGDGTAPHFLESGKITAYSESEDWFLAEEVFTHTFATPNNRGAPWQVAFTGCCRVSGVRNGGDAGWDMRLDVDLLHSLQSVRVVSLPVIFISGPGGPAGPHFKLATAGHDPAAESVVWTMGGAGGPLSIDASGRVTYTPAPPPSPAPDFELFHLLAYAATTTRAAVPLDIIVNVTHPRVPRPSFLSATQLYPHSYSAPLALNNLDTFKVQAFPGFPLQVEFAGFQDTGAPSYIGYTVARLPRGAIVSTVQGAGTSAGDAARVTVTLNACPAERGSVPVCLDLTNSEGVPATQHCLEIEVVPDPPPSLALSLSHGDDCIWNCGGAGSSASPAELYMGREYTLHLHAQDHNPQDSLEIIPAACQQVPPSRTFAQACEDVPWGASLSEPHQERAATLAVTRTLPLAPGYAHGGYSMRHCFQAMDGCGALREGPAACGGSDAELSCPGVRAGAVQCVLLHVHRCQFVVQAGQSLNQIAAMYKTDWLQLWSHNSHLDSPDISLQANAVLQVGRVYDVQPHDSPRAVAERFGVAEEVFLLLNADHAAHAWAQPSCTSLEMCRQLAGNLTGIYQWCVLPSSCDGRSGSIYHAQPAPAPALPAAVPGGAPMRGSGV